jgi:hypothetical protein
MILTAKDLSEYRRKIVQATENIEFPVVVNIEHGDIRSVNSNRRYWAGVVTAIQNHLERETGQKHTKEAVHHFLKVERYGKRVDTINGKTYERVARSSKMTQKQFNQFAEWAEAYAISELGVDPLEIDNYHEVRV